MNILITLYLVFFKIGLFAFGGGYGILALLERDVVHNYAWLNLVDLANIISIAEITPGPIFVNAATFVGYKLAGVLGGVIATIGSITPAFCLTLLVISFFKKSKINSVISYVKIVVVAMMASALLTMIKVSIADWRSILIFALAVFFSLRPKNNPIPIILGGGILGFILFSVF